MAASEATVIANWEKPETDSQIDERSTSVPWFRPEPPELSPVGQEIFEKYSGLAPDKIIPHIIGVRNKAWQVWPYPCLGMFGFLHFSISQQPVYSEVLEKIKNGGQYLDIGCCFAQDIRKLVFDGAPKSNIRGSDLRFDYINLGYELFLDKETLGIQFFEADVFDSESDLKQFDGEMDIVHAAAFFHLFDYDDQVKVGKRVVKLLKPQEGSMVLGRQVASLEPGPKPHRTNPEKFMYRHDGATWQKMWDEIGEATGSKWKASVEIKDMHSNNRWPPDPNIRLMVFQVVRL